MHRCTTALTAWGPLDVLTHVCARYNGDTFLAVKQFSCHAVKHHAWQRAIYFTYFRAGTCQKTQEGQCVVLLCHAVKAGSSVLFQVAHDCQCGAGLLFREFVLSHGSFPCLV